MGVDYRFCDRCWTWVENKIGGHFCVKRPRPDVLPLKPGSDVKAKPVEKIDEGLKEAKPAKVVASKPKTWADSEKAIEAKLKEKPDDVGLRITALSVKRMADRERAEVDAPKGTQPKPNGIEEKSRKPSPRAPKPVAKVPVQPDPKPKAICQPEQKPVSRSTKWRQANREKSRAYMSKYMKDRRAQSAEDRDRAKYEALRARFEGKAE